MMPSFVNNLMLNVIVWTVVVVISAGILLLRSAFFDL